MKNYFRIYEIEWVSKYFHVGLKQTNLMLSRELKKICKELELDIIKIEEVSYNGIDVFTAGTYPKKAIDSLEEKIRNDDLYLYEYRKNFISEFELKATPLKFTEEKEDHLNKCIYKAIKSKAIKLNPFSLVGEHSIISRKEELPSPLCFVEDKKIIESVNFLIENKKVIKFNIDNKTEDFIDICAGSYSTRGRGK